MVQVTNSTFKNIKVKVSSLIAIKEVMEAGIITNNTLLLHDSYVNEETVSNLFPFLGAQIENLMEKLHSAAYILNLINNKILLATNEVKTIFIPMVKRSRAGLVQEITTKKIQPLP